MNTRNNDNYWIKSGLFNILQNLSGVAFAFGSFYFLVRILDEHTFGVWTLFLSSITILEIVRGGLIQNALIKFISGEDKSEHKKIITASFAITTFLTLICIIINIGFARYLPLLWKSPELSSLFYIYNAAFLLSGVLTLFNCIEQANLKFKGVFVSSFIRQGAFFIYVLICFIFNLKITLFHLVCLQIITLTICVVTSYFYTRTYLSFSNKIDFLWLKKLFNYGKYAFGTSVSAILANTIDQMMLGALISANAAGAFNIAIRITNLVDIPTNALAAIVFPQSARRIEKEGVGAIKYLYEKSVGTLMAILVPGILFLYLFTDFVVDFIAGTKYPETVPLLHITLAYCLLVPYGRQVGTILDSIGKTKLNFYLVLFTAVINLLLNYPMINYWGILGAAYSSLVAGIIGFIAAQIILKKQFNVNIFNTFIYAFEFYPEFYNKYIKTFKSTHK